MADTKLPLLTIAIKCDRSTSAITRWRAQISAWHRARFTNGPTEAVNNLVKRVKRVAFGITNWTNYRTRALLYAGRPNWSLLAINSR